MAMAVVPTEFCAVVLAAGRSTRMGRDKALLEVDGVPLWRRQRDVLRAAGAVRVHLSARPDQVWTSGVTGFGRIIPDTFPGLGPVGGIFSTLGRPKQPHVAYLAIDMPRMSPAWFVKLAGLCAPGVGVVGRLGRHYEPLAAVYPREMLPLVTAMVAIREYSLQRMVQSAVASGELREIAIEPAEEVWFENWNEPAQADVHWSV